MKILTLLLCLILTPTLFADTADKNTARSTTSNDVTSEKEEYDSLRDDSVRSGQSSTRREARREARDTSAANSWDCADQGGRSYSHKNDPCGNPLNRK